MVSKDDFMYEAGDSGGCGRNRQGKFFGQEIVRQFATILAPFLLVTVGVWGV